MAFSLSRVLQSNGYFKSQSSNENKIYSENAALSIETFLHVSFDWRRVNELFGFACVCICGGVRPAMNFNSTFCSVFQTLNNTFQDKSVLMLK